MRFEIVHQTVYRFHRPVELGEHRLMIRPRDSHDLRLVEATLQIEPPSALRWVHDVFGNSIALASFAGRHDGLSITSRLVLERFARQPQSLEVDPKAACYPFAYGASDRLDLGATTRMEDPAGRDALRGWTSGFLPGRRAETLDLLTRMASAIRAEFTYEPRAAEGTQAARETLRRRSGTCRDFAMLLIEAARHLGLGARFVTGYLYDPALDPQAADEPSAPIRGAASTHAWAEVYLPGAGWIEFDPTNGTVASGDLIRVAVTRSPSQALPVSGTFLGSRNDAAGMEVTVRIRAIA
ncbi:transglutaminase family protein [Geminicoccus roseus]|uniref:transglutaminase family protein n=1 Tax=Geminicoccus roseus TaxID=404900 RepID=UPI000411A950|nr:transglutaminase family protein [Geminicoccus roseus]